MEIKTTDFDGIKLTAYQGKYSIEALRAKDDKLYPVWAKYQKGRDEFQEKSWPVKIILGEYESAVKALREMLIELDGKSPSAQQAPIDDTPF